MQDSATDTGEEIKAPIMFTWVRWMAIRGAIFIVVSLIFFWDGAYAWPERNKIVEQYLAYIEADKSVHDWPRYAEEELGLEPPMFSSIRAEYDEEDYKKPEKLREQFYIGGLLVFCGLLFFGKILLDRKKILYADDNAVTADDGTTLAFDRITQIDTAKWEVKGLAYLRYEEEGEKEGEKKKVILDDLKYDGAGKILERAQRKLGVPTESEKRAAKEAEAAAAAANSSEEEPEK